MKPVIKLRILEILAGLEQDAVYRNGTPPVLEPRMHRFRQDVERLRIRCLETHPRAATEAEIRDRLERLIAQADGTLYRFRFVIQRAKEALQQE